MLKPISWKKLIQRFHALGFDGPFSGGRHFFIVKGNFKLHIPNPHGRDISPYLLAEILRQAGIDFKDWEQL